MDEEKEKVKIDDDSSTSSNSSNIPKDSAWKRFLVFLQGTTEDDEELQAEPVPFKELFRYATRKEKFLMAIGIVCSIVHGICLPSINIIVGLLMTVYISTPEPVGNTDFLRTVLIYSACYLGAGCFIFIIATFEYFTLTWASEQIVSRIKRVFVSSVLAKDATFLHSTSAGALSNQLNNDIDRIRDGLGDKVGMLCRSIAFYLSAITVSFITDWRMTLIMIWTGPLCALSTAVTPKFTSKYVGSMLKITEDANGLAEECILNVKTVAACNGEESMIKRYGDILRRGISASVRSGAIAGAFEGLFFFFLYLFCVLGLWYGTVAYHNGEIRDAGNVLAVSSNILFSSYILGILGPHLMSILKARSAAAVVYATIDKIPDVDVTTDAGLDIDSKKSVSIEFNNVQFTYPTRKSPVLQCLNWKVKEGETVALVGASGCGKSTSIGLLTCMLRATGGSIELNGKPIEKYNVKRLRKMIGLVSQEPTLFHGTIRDNIQLGRDVSENEIEKAARTANAHDFIMHLEKGYDTMLGPSGVSLSGGQKQRIAIARAIVTDPSILLLDEATSALDSHSERVVQAALNKASAGRTTIVIAHRLSTIKDAHRVYVMDEGRVIEEGSYSDLQTKEGGMFAKMLSMQDGKKAEEELEVVYNDEWREEERDRLNETILSHSGASPLVRQGSIISSRRSLKPISPVIEKTNDDEFPSSVGGITQLLSQHKLKVFKQMLAGCVRGSEMLFLVFVWNITFRQLNEEDYQGWLLATSVGQIIIGVGTMIAIIISRTTSAWVSESILIDIRLKCFSSLLYRPISYFDRADTSPAACSVILSQQVPLASAPVDYRATIVYENTFAAISIILVCFIYCWQNGLIAILVAFLFLVLFFFLQRQSQRANEEVESIDTSAELAVEIFEQASTIQLLTVNEYFVGRYEEILKRRTKALRRRTFCRALIHAFSSSSFYFSNCLATGLGSYLIYSGIVAVQDLYTSEICVSSVGWCVMIMAASFNDLIGSSSAIKSLFSIIDPKRDEKMKGEEPNISGHIKVRNVYFAYPSRPSQMVARNLNFKLDKGCSLALVGPSGGGKSTIVNLLERFYEPRRGTIELDGNPISTMSLKHVRANIALVSQEPTLFRGTIRDNITLGVEDVTLEQVMTACKLANASDFIQAFPEGYDTSVGEKGKSLSGGQKQRIAIARALIRNPKIIVLDEATSALDTQSEKIVKKALEISATGRTSITIAHRLDTIRNCDTILFIEHGEIVEEGSHEELIRLQGRYCSLVREQKLL